MKKKSIAMFLAMIALTFGLVVVPKTSSAYAYNVSEDWTDVNGCHIHVVRTYNVDI